MFAERPSPSFYQSASARTSVSRLARYQPERQLLGGIRTHQKKALFDGALKNRGDFFKHDFDHGEKSLSTVPAHLTILAILPDPAAQLQPALANASERRASSVLLGRSAAPIPRIPEGLENAPQSPSGTGRRWPSPATPPDPSPGPSAQGRVLQKKLSGQDDVGTESKRGPYASTIRPPATTPPCRASREIL